MYLLHTAQLVAKDYHSQTEKHQFHKDYYYLDYYFGRPEPLLSLERMSYNHAMSMTDLTWEELYIMHNIMKLKPVPVFTARYKREYIPTHINFLWHELL